MRSRVNSCLDGKSKKKYIKREIDFGNPRFAASKASSQAGGLINGRHTVDGFYRYSKDEKDEDKSDDDDMKSVEDEIDGSREENEE